MPSSTKKRTVVVPLLPGNGDESDTNSTISSIDTRPAKKSRKEFQPDDLICPITTELPWDPVVADDGRTYERSAIETHIKARRDNGLELRSPFTNQPMGERLLPNIQHRNLIESLIDSGIITGSLADPWNQKKSEQEAKKNLMKRAHDGEAKAMFILGHHYYVADCGYEEDHKLAYEWFKKSHDAGCKHATCYVGHLMLYGEGVAKDTQQGLLYLGMAAGCGADTAGVKLAKVYAKGRYGIPKNKKMAIYWLKQALAATPEVMGFTTVGRAKLEERLREYEALPETDG